MKTLTKVLVILGIFLFAFIVVMVITFWKFQAVPDVLVTCVLGTSTAELIATTLIEISKKKFEVKNEGKDNVNNTESFEG